MQIVKNILISEETPPITNVLWLQQLPNNGYALKIYKNGKWEELFSTQKIISTITLT